MAERHASEVITGAAVLLLAGGFMAYAVAHTGRSATNGYDITAKFDNIDGLNIGSDVRIGGVKIGSVVATALDPKTFQAVVKLGVKNDLQIPKDSSAIVTSDGLLGGKYLAIQPGGDAENLPHGGEIMVTQGSVSLESLLGKFIFNMTSSKKSDAAPPAPGAAPTPPATGPVSAPPATPH